MKPNRKIENSVNNITNTYFRITGYFDILIN